MSACRRQLSSTAADRNVRSDVLYQLVSALFIAVADATTLIRGRFRPPNAKSDYVARRQLFAEPNLYVHQACRTRMDEQRSTSSFFEAEVAASIDRWSVSVITAIMRTADLGY